MNNIASILLLILLAVTFIQSGYDKTMYWNDNVGWLKKHFENTPIRNMVPSSLFLILVLEIVSGILCISGCIQLLVNNGRSFGLYGAIFSCITLIFLLVGQRMAKDYDGARTIVIYFVPAVMAVYWLS
ncbi:MAG: DoxX family protein [Flavobacterium sp. BFFFF1]|uniref:DoxX family protein n=1 Tax=unclassified Flavobacterium TaxID=196869 RepID=UPI000BD5A2ED|nr:MULTISPECIES: DoxX family protein [unclassified Flavobacterium]OYU81365.1 MAG: DoxX family protein [Flavobacterium sp. BFFFF1]